MDRAPVSSLNHAFRVACNFAKQGLNLLYLSIWAMHFNKSPYHKTQSINHEKGMDMQTIIALCGHTLCFSRMGTIFIRLVFQSIMYRKSSCNSLELLQGVALPAHRARTCILNIIVHTPTNIRVYPKEFQQNWRHSLFTHIFSSARSSTHQ